MLLLLLQYNFLRQSRQLLVFRKKQGQSKEVLVCTQKSKRSQERKRLRAGFFQCALVDAGVLPQTLYPLVSLKCPGLRQGTKGVSGSRIRPPLPNTRRGPPTANQHLSRCQGTGSGGQPTGSGHGILDGHLGKSCRRQKSRGERKNKEGLRGR